MEKMLKENKNIDHSYTDRVIRQLVDETEIDFNTGRVRLPIAAYSWPFQNFGSGGFENILTMKKSSKFAQHIITNYGVDEEEFKEILAMYIGVIAARIQDGLNELINKRDRENPHWLQEQIGYDDDAPNEVERQARYATQVVDRMVRETKIDDSHEDPSQWNIYAPHMGRWIGPMGFISPNNRHWSAFEDHVMDIYGLDWEMVGTAWNNYLEEVTSNFRVLARKAHGPDTPPIHYNYYLGESTEDKFLDTIVNQLVNETEIEYDDGIPHISAFPDPDFSMDTSFYLNKDLWENLFGDMFKSFWTHCREVYGLTDAEIQKVWWAYKTEVLEKINFTPLNESLSSRVKKEVEDLWDEDKKLKDEDKIKKYFKDKGLNKQDADEAMVQYLSKQQSLNESKEDLDSYIHKVVNRMVDNTHLSGEEIGNIRVKLPFSIKGHISTIGQFDEIGQYYITSPTARVVAEIRKHLILIYGMDKWETDQAALMYLSKMTEKINDYKGEGLNESVDLSYSDDKDFPFLNKLANHTMSITEIGRNAVLFPFIDGYISDGNFHKYFHGTPYDQLPFEATLKLDEYLRDFGLTENEKEIWWDIYVIKVMEAVGRRDLRIIDNYGELNESIGDNVLDRIAYSMYKESISTPDSFPFDSTSMSFSDYVKNMYGLSDEETEYVYWEFRHLKGWSEPDPYLPDPLNEHTFADDIDYPIYEKIANTLANESEIVISPSPYNKMFLRSPAWKEAQHIENVIDQLTGRIKDVVPHLFAKHLKEIYNIKYPTFVNKVWRLYKDKILKQIEDAQERLSVPKPNKQQKFFDHIVKTLVDETEIESTRHVHDEGRERIWVTPPFLIHGIDGGPRYQEGSVDWSDFSYFGYGYARYMKDIYGLTDKEGLKLWAVYYKALEKKVDELIERDRIIYGDD